MFLIYELISKLTLYQLSHLLLNKTSTTRDAI